eukprot:5851140-Ditylum_brightwellii.AAC.1
MQELCDEYSSNKFRLLSCRIDKHKTNNVVEDTMLFYPDISGIAEDVYFALAYYLILEKGQGASELTFDDLAKKVHDYDCKVKSKVSIEWTALYEQLCPGPTTRPSPPGPTY